MMYCITSLFGITISVVRFFENPSVSGEKYTLNHPSPDYIVLLTCSIVPGSEYKLKT